VARGSGGAAGSVARGPKRLVYTSKSPAVVHLRTVGGPLAQAIDAVGDIRIELATDRFAALARAIVFQQLSGASARAIYGRVSELTGMTPGGIAEAGPDALLAAGLSRQKLNYLTGLADDVLTGRVLLDDLDSLDDEEVIERLTTIKGVGRWTAEMFLMFTLGRPDVFAVDDLGIRHAAEALLNGGLPLTPEGLLEIAEPWRPYRTAASLYLWRAHGAGLW
jgi:DNA-3-methyladenine glycosylase II